MAKVGASRILQIRGATGQGRLLENELLNDFLYFWINGKLCPLISGLLTYAISFSMLIPQTREIYLRITKEIVRKKLEMVEGR